MKLYQAAQTLSWCCSAQGTLNLQAVPVFINSAVAGGARFSPEMMDDILDGSIYITPGATTLKVSGRQDRWSFHVSTKLAPNNLEATTQL